MNKALTVKTTKYFNEYVMKKRPYVTPELCAQILANPLRKEKQDDGRFRYVGRDPDPEREGKYWRIITLEDGETIHNAFRDRSVKMT